MVVVKKIVDVWAGIDFLEFRASEIAAAVALSVSGEHFDKFSFSSSFSSLEKVREVTKSLLHLQK